MSSLPLSLVSQSGGQRQQAVEDFEVHVNEAASKLERNKTKYERLAKTLIDVNAGGEFFRFEIFINFLGLRYWEDCSFYFFSLFLFGLYFLSFSFFRCCSHC